MKLTKILTLFPFILICSCNSNKVNDVTNNLSKSDSLILVNMVRERAIAKEKHDIVTELSQFSDDATFINSDGLLLPNKKALEKHLKAVNSSSLINS